MGGFRLGKRFLVLVVQLALAALLAGAPAGCHGPAAGPPTLHRVDDSACSVAPGPGSCTISSPSNQCTNDSDCTAGTNGRCRATGGPAPPFCACMYDGCQSDADCASSSGGPCLCHGTFGAQANTCIAGNCRTDADCGAGGYCSPSTSAQPGGCGGWYGFYCHTAADTCINDADCPSNSSAAGACAYDAAVKHWRCVLKQPCG